ncbi:3-oxoacyl-ACP reductase [Pseudomonas sp. Z18(2022)]|uniref:3-oxoacyl-ACP reductase n=1 Tax=Pseudomonas sp. Z18(2022) TaxID=2983410 RepID=UPI002E817168|nr:3-oxoacyl-ACP reductase [Pseudomonas sp. Z18(2022)]
MSDLLMQLHANPLSAWLARALGLPNPVPLARELGAYATRPLAGKIAWLGACEESENTRVLRGSLQKAGADLCDVLVAADQTLDVVVLDASGCRTPAQYRFLYDSLNPRLRKLAVNARVLIVATDPDSLDSPVAAAVARGIEGFSRSLSKEVGKKGITVNLVYVGVTGAERLEGVVRFFCAKQTTYVTGQAVHIRTLVATPEHLPTEQVLAGKVALVTGSARGIGLATAQRLAQEGATLVCLDVPAMTLELEQRCKEIGATPLGLDIASSEAPRRLADFLMERFGGVDIVVHNAGITRDRTLANMKEHLWDQVVAVNLAAIVAVDEVLIGERVLRDQGRVVCLSSISGVAGNFGQTNYAATKAALIGYVRAQALGLSERNICINAIAPGFIETPMTDAMPFATREIGRRLNSLKQSGAPRDAAEMITFLCSPQAYGVTGSTLRVCGQGLIGA